ncbi:MAG: RNA-binding S4 domain-containing protein [Acholeplasmatales bacterium]|nr:RNA-binding S4 domain-containing protein [Acholeplasmatales bacterium]
MRVDKYLKVSRLIKRRTVAKEVADHEKIKINGKVCKPSTEIKINDIVEIRFGLKIVTFKVLNTNEFVKKNEADLMYEIIKEEKVEE